MQRTLAALLLLPASLSFAVDSPGPGGPLVMVQSSTNAPLVRASRMRAKVTIVDGVASTRLTLTIVNAGATPAEATWLLPLPAGSVADDFRMQIGGRLVRGEVLDSGRARGVYEGIVRARRDPGLLEYVGRGCLKARLFPIPANGSIDVEVGYREVLPRLGGMTRWSFPIASAGLDGAAPEQVVLDLELESKRTLHNCFSPTPGMHVVTENDHRARASYEGRGAGVAGGEFGVMYTLDDGDFGLDLLSTRGREEADGSFLMLISPKREATESAATKREIVFAVDTSGSMAGAKIEQARGALRFFLQSLSPQDRFDVVPFSTEATPFFGAPVAADRTHIDQALARAKDLKAAGGTNIADALHASLALRSRSNEYVPIVVFLTDGLPSVDLTDVAAILARTREWNVATARIFAFGVGDDVNTALLDTLAEDSGGTRCYVRPSESIELATGELFAALSHPALTDLALEFEGATVERVVPKRIPDLFHGGRVVVAGRYRGAGPCKVKLSGNLAGERRTFEYTAELASGPVAGLDFVPSLWAERRVAMLLDQIRLHGADPELIAEVRTLGVEHRIVTPYTSHLIVEEGLALAPRTPGSPGGGGGGGPATPGPGGPSTPGPSSPGSPGPGSYTPRGADLAAIARQLVDAGVLPKSAPPEEAKRLALEIVKELRASDQALAGLGGRTGGSGAIDDSVYLAKLVGARGAMTGSDDFFAGNGRPEPRDDLLSLFTRKVKDKVFVLREGVWTDRTPVDANAPRTSVEAFSDAWFELLRAQPALAPYFAFSTRLLVVLDGRVYEVHAPH
ncbi:MAG: VIT and VWA domain-containing protein [Planctomycetes bacterium]|nr:VIT and VWA domain-containing protein [Planctomycetota bacterium]